MISNLPDPDFAAARKHADTVRSGMRKTIAACIALGLELIRLKENLGYQRGGDRRSKTDYPSLKWSDLVEQETGFSSDRCNDFIKAAKAVRERLTGSRKQGDKEVKLIVQSPPSEWTDEHYLAFSEHIEDNFKADTFKALMLDLGFGPKPIEPPKGGGGGNDLQGDFYHAMLAAHDCVASPILSLHRTSLNPAEFLRYIYDLPIQDTDVEVGQSTRHITGLHTLQHILTQASDQIADAIKKKQKGAK